MLKRALSAFAGQLELHSFVCMSNHWHFVVRVANSTVLPRFMQLLKSSTANAMNELRDRTGTFWSGRYKAVAILDEESLLGMMAYTLFNPVRAGIASTAREHVGLSSIEQNCGIRGACGPVELVPEVSPSGQAFEELDPARRRAWLRRELREREREMRLDRIHKGLPRPKPEYCRRIDPFSRPASPARRPQPSCFARCAQARDAHQASNRAIDEAYVDASARYRAGDPAAVFPHGTFPPRLDRPFIEAPE